MDKFAQLAAAGSDISQAALGIDIPQSGEELNQLDAVLRDGGTGDGLPDSVPGCQ